MRERSLYVNGLPRSTVGAVTVKTERGTVPGKLTFRCLDRVSPGDNVTFRCDGKDVFRGKVFEVIRSGGCCECTAYDLLRYFKNKATITYSDKTAGELLLMLSCGFNIPTGEIADTKMKISGQIDDGRELFTIIGNALSLTSLAGYGSYVLYDDCGAICLKDRDSLCCGIAIRSELCSSFTVTETIDEGVYNDVSLTEMTEDGRVFHRFKNDESIEKYGHLSYLGALSAVENAAVTGAGILASSSSPSVTVTCETFDLLLPIRGGGAVDVYLDGEKKRMICQKAELIYGVDTPSMKLTLTSV